MVHCLKLAAVYRNERFSEKIQALAQHNELTTGAADRFAVVFAKPRNGLKVRCQTAREPHQFNVALCLALKATTGLNTIRVTVDVDLKHHLRVI
jgi:hypothetical protein